MPPILTEAQALALIANRSSAFPGPKLAAATRWTNLGADDVSLWGECTGSGKEPYQVAAGLLETAGKCSCPSPDTPCKHAAGLLLLYVKSPELFTTPAPDTLAAWRRARQQHAERQTRRGQPRDPALAAAAEARLAEGVDAKRQKRMVAGAAELSIWLEDLVQQGLATLHQQKPEFWEQPAQRAVDNQLPSLAAALRELPELATNPEQLLPRLGELYMLLRAVQNIPNLPTAARQEVLQQTGVTFRREDLLDAYEPVADNWLVMGQVEGDEQDKWGRVRSPNRRTWLYGTDTGRYAMLYEFAFGQQQLPAALRPGSRLAASLVFYPGLLPLRATSEQPFAAPDWQTEIPTDAPVGQTIGQLLTGYAAALGRAPWLRQWPVVLAGVRPAELANGHRALHHPAEGLTIPLLNVKHHSSSGLRENLWWDLLGASLEEPCTVAGEWDGRALRLLRVWPGSQPAPANLPTRGATAPNGNGYGPPWPALVQAATVGTRTTPVPELPGLPPTAAPAQRLLLAAGTTALLQKTGYESPADAKVLLPDGPPETWLVLDPTAAALLSKVGIGILIDFMRQLRERQLRVPSHLVLALLRRVNLRYPYTQALGETGTWLMQQKKEWRAQLNLPETTSYSGWSHEQPGRKQPSNVPTPTRSIANMTEWVAKKEQEVSSYLHWLHHTDPEAARPLLQEALAAAEQLYNPVDYLPNLLTAFDYRELTLADAAIIEPYMVQIHGHRTQLCKPVREQLLRMPDSPLQERVWARTTPLFAVQRPAGGPPVLKVKLPKSWDESWLADAIEESEWGITSKKEGGIWGQQLWRMLALLPPRRWAEHFGLSVPELLALAAAHQYGPSILRAWAEANELYPEREVTELLVLHQAQGHLGADFSQRANERLLNCLTGDELLDFAHRCLLLQPALPGLLPLLLLNFYHRTLLLTPWPTALAAALPNDLRTALLPSIGVGDGHDPVMQWLNAVSQAICHTICVPDELLPHYAEELPALADDFPQVAHYLRQMLASITLRLQLQASLI